MFKIKKILTNQQQIENTKDLIMKWYNKEDYYNFTLEIWKLNILLKLKEVENKNEKKMKYKNNIK